MISIVMPVYNEEKYIENCINSLLKQTFPQKDMEWIFVDGGSTDKTKEILNDFKKKHPDLIKVFDNPYKTVPFAMNIGIKQSRGEYIIRLDAHAEYEKSYFEKCVRYLKTIDADNVGGVLTTKSNTRSGKVISKLLSSPFGVGNSRFRINGKSGYVDTVPFGAFRRDVFSRFGGYDERLVRNQDNELNYRIRKNGGKIYLANDISLSYFCRDSVRSLSAMARKNGKWNIITMKLCPGTMGLRHFIPFLFLVSLLTLLLIGFFWKIAFFLLLAEICIYAILDLLFSFKACGIRLSVFYLFILFPTFHINYGIGSLLGLFCLFSKKFKQKGYSAPKL